MNVSYHASDWMARPECNVTSLLMIGSWDLWNLSLIYKKCILRIQWKFSHLSLMIHTRFCHLCLVFACSCKVHQLHATVSLVILFSILLFIEHSSRNISAQFEDIGNFLPPPGDECNKLVNILSNMEVLNGSKFYKCYWRWRFNALNIQVLLIASFSFTQLRIRLNCWWGWAATGGEI